MKKLKVDQETLDRDPLLALPLGKPAVLRFKKEKVFETLGHPSGYHSELEEGTDQLARAYMLEKGINPINFHTALIDIDETTNEYLLNVYPHRGLAKS